MFEFDRDHHTRMSKAIADRPAKPGLERGMLEPGDVVTFSRNKVTGDRSYIDQVWRLVATNGVLGQFVCVGGSSFYLDRPIRLMLDEYEFYDGRAFLPEGDR